MTLVPPVPADVTVAPDTATVDSAVVDSAAQDSAVVDSAAQDSTVVDSAVADRPETDAREAAPVRSGLPVPPPRPADTEQGQEPEPVNPPVGSAPGPRLRHVRIDPPAGARGESDDPAPGVPRTPPRLGVVAVPPPSRTTSDRRSGTPSVRPVRLMDTTATPVGLPGAPERPAAVTPVPLPVPRPAGPITPAVPPSTESRTEEPQP
ncbi:hypothetical protein ACIO8G_24580 [Streptomyces sp. NPDC087219]|uniref:hypothetical protein n=1 Tax=Streptomyces sp. NPDC087219 TaxID=3365770 RepID=UPI0038216B58